MSFVGETQNNVKNSTMCWVSIMTINHFTFKDRELVISSINEVASRGCLGTSQIEYGGTLDSWDEKLSMRWSENINIILWLHHSCI